MKLRKILAAVAGGAVVATVAALWAPSAAWADTHPVLNQTGKHILASNPGYDGNADCQYASDDTKDVWVFVWPGKNKVGEITEVEIGWDTNVPPDNTADYFLHLSDGIKTTDNGTLKIVFVTPAGYRLETGSSTVTGETASGKFNLTHTCSGTPDNQVDPCEQGSTDPGCQPPDDPCLTDPDAPECNPEPCPDTAAAANPDCPPSTSDTPTTTTTTPGLPATGAALTGLIAAGVALVAGGGTLLVVMRRRRTALGE